MDILSNTNVSGVFKATKIKQSFHNHYDPIDPNAENGFFYVPVYEVYTETFGVGEKSKTVYYGFFTNSHPPIIQAFDVDSGKQVILDYRIDTYYDDGASHYIATRSDDSVEQTIRFVSIGLLSNINSGPQL